MREPTPQASEPTQAPSFLRDRAQLFSIAVQLQRVAARRSATDARAGFELNAVADRVAWLASDTKSIEDLHEAPRDEPPLDRHGIATLTFARSLGVMPNEEATGEVGIITKGSIAKVEIHLPGSLFALEDARQRALKHRIEYLERVSADFMDHLSTSRTLAAEPAEGENPAPVRVEEQGVDYDKSWNSAEEVHARMKALPPDPIALRVTNATLVFEQPPNEIRSGSKTTVTLKIPNAFFDVERTRADRLDKRITMIAEGLALSERRSTDFLNELQATAHRLISTEPR